MGREREGTEQTRARNRLVSVFTEKMGVRVHKSRIRILE
jgi:hypothetical protein